MTGHPAVRRERYSTERQKENLHFFIFWKRVSPKKRKTVSSSSSYFYYSSFSHSSSSLLMLFWQGSPKNKTAGGLNHSGLNHVGEYAPLEAERKNFIRGCNTCLGTGRTAFLHRLAARVALNRLHLPLFGLAQIRKAPKNTKMSQNRNRKPKKKWGPFGVEFEAQKGTLKKDTLVWGFCAFCSAKGL